MYLVLENTKQTFEFPANRELVLGNDADCDVQINHPKIWGRHFSIAHKSYGCVLNVFNESVKVNDTEIGETCLLDTGDLITIDDLGFRLLDDGYIPKDSQLNHTNASIHKPANVSSVFGIRSYATDDTGLFIIDNFHHPDGWHVIREDNELHLLDSKNITLLNGMRIAQARLSNGDMISNDDYKFKVELPGTSGFSKFSPSHPRNVQLSESFTAANDKGQKPSAKSKQAFLKNNLWWMTLLVGLAVLVLVIMNNPSG